MHMLRDTAQARSTL